MKTYRGGLRSLLACHPKLRVLWAESSWRYAADMGHVRSMLKRAIEARGFYLRRRTVLPYGIDFFTDISRIAAMMGGKINSFFDVGAWRGDVSQRALIEYPQARVTAFEPNPAHHAVLARMHSAEPRFSFHPFALGATDGMARLFCNSTLRESMVFQDDGADSIEVQQARLDSYCRINHSADIDVIKLDAEGAEMAILRGGEETIATRGVRFVYCEFFNDGRGTSLPALLDFLGAYGFRLIATYTEHVVRENGHIFACANALFVRL